MNTNSKFDQEFKQTPLVNLPSNMVAGQKAKRIIRVKVLKVIESQSAQAVKHKIAIVKDKSCTRAVRQWTSTTSDYNPLILREGQSYAMQVTVIKNEYSNVIFLDRGTVLDEKVEVTSEITGLEEVQGTSEDFEDVIVSEKLTLKKVYPTENNSVVKLLFTKDQLKPLYLRLTSQDPLFHDIASHEEENFLLTYYCATTKAAHKSITLKAVKGLSVAVMTDDESKI